MILSGEKSYKWNDIHFPINSMGALQESWRCCCELHSQHGMISLLKFKDFTKRTCIFRILTLFTLCCYIYCLVVQVFNDLMEFIWEGTLWWYALNRNAKFCSWGFNSKLFFSSLKKIYRSLSLKHIYSWKGRFASPLYEQ